MKWLMAMVAAFVLSGCNSGKTEIREIPIGYQGEARVNPYLAAERFLKEEGWSVRSSRVWDDYGYQAGLVFMPAPFLGSKAEGMRVLEWVADGGILVLTIEGGEPERNDFTAFSSGNGIPREGDYPGMDYLLEEIGVEIVLEDWESVSDDALTQNEMIDRPWHIAELNLDGEDEIDLEFEGDVALRAKDGYDWEENFDLPSRVISTAHGMGTVVVMAHARPLRSPYLDRADHARFLEMMAEWDRSGEIVFLYGSSLSFSGLVWQRAGMVVISGLILLVAWLWMRIPRLGPILQDSYQLKRPYGTALIDSARFLWRGGHVVHLIRPLRERLERDHQGDPGNLYQRLSDRSGLPREEVAEALTVLPGKDPGSLIKLVQKLQALLKK